MLLLVAASMVALAPVAFAQTLTEAFAYKEARKIVEVRVHERSKPGGRGWAVTGEEGGIEYCFIVTPFHVIGDLVTRTLYSDIVASALAGRMEVRQEHPVWRINEPQSRNCRGGGCQRRYHRVQKWQGHHGP